MNLCWVIVFGNTKIYLFYMHIVLQCPRLYTDNLIVAVAGSHWVKSVAKKAQHQNLLVISPAVVNLEKVQPKSEIKTISVTPVMNNMSFICYYFSQRLHI